MSEISPEPKELVRQDHITQLSGLFRNQMQNSKNLSKTELKQLNELYDIAYTEDKENPVGWIADFDRIHPHDLEIGVETTRLGKILAFARLYADQKKKGSNRGMGFSDREF